MAGWLLLSVLLSVLLLFALGPFAASLPLLRLLGWLLAVTGDEWGGCWALPIRLPLLLQVDEEDALEPIPEVDEPCDEEPLAVVEVETGELGMRDDA